MTAPNDQVRIVPLTPSTSEVRLCAARGTENVGKVVSSNGSWFWQHRDGERSSPLAANPSDAAHQLVQYHREFKDRRDHSMPERRLLFG